MTARIIALLADGEILLVAPTSSLDEARTAYDEFVRSMKFGK